jgi:hypothetical protein
LAFSCFFERLKVRQDLITLNSSEQRLQTSAEGDSEAADPRGDNEDATVWIEGAIAQTPMAAIVKGHRCGGRTEETHQEVSKMGPISYERSLRTSK